MPPKSGRTVTAPRRTPPSTAGSEGSTRRRSARHTQGDASWSLPALPDSILMRPPERWVCVHFKLLHVSLLDDVVRLPPNATLHTLEAKLMAHHGGAVKGIEMYKDDTQPKNKLRDFSLTLKEAFGLEDAMPSTVPFPNIPSSSGVGPALVLSPEDHHVTVCYDFKSHDSDCPLLNRSPRYRSGQPSYGDANNNNSVSGGAQHSSTSRFLNQTTTSTTGGGASPSAASNANNNTSTTTTSGAVNNKDNNGNLHQIGLTAPLTISTSSGENLGVGVGSARGGLRGWAPQSENTSNNQQSSPSPNRAATTATSQNHAVPNNNIPHPPRPLRKFAALSSPSRLDEAIIVAANNNNSSQHFSTSTTPLPPHLNNNHNHSGSSHTNNASGSSTPVPSAAGGEHQQQNNDGAIVGVAGNTQRDRGNLKLLSVSATGRTDTFLEKIRMTSEKSGEAARMSDIAFATARRAADTHSPSRHSTTANTVSANNNSVTSPSKFSSRLAVAHQRNAAARSHNVVSENPQWNLHAENGVVFSTKSLEEQSQEQPQEEQQPRQQPFVVTGASHVEALVPLAIPAKLHIAPSKERQHLESAKPALEMDESVKRAAEESNHQQTLASQRVAATSIVVSGSIGCNDDFVKGETVCKMLEASSFRERTTSVAFVHNSIGDGNAIAELVRGLCPVKVHTEEYLEPKTEEELEEEKALAEEQKQQAQELAAQQQEEEDAALDDDEAADYDYEAPKLKVPEHALPAPTRPNNMKELVRFVVTKRDATVVSAIKISKNPLAFVTRSGAAASALPAQKEDNDEQHPQDPEVAEQEQALLNAFAEHAEAVCDAPTAAEALGKYILTFRPEVEYDSDDQIRMQREIDEAAGEEEQHQNNEHQDDDAAAAAEHDQKTDESQQIPLRKPVPLRILDLSENALGAIFPTLAPALTQAASIRSLNLAGNGLGNPTAILEELFPRGLGGDGTVGGDEASADDVATALETLIKENKFLEHINLADNEIKSELAVRLFAALRESKTRAPTPPPEEAPAFEAFEDELPPPEFEGDDEVIPTQEDLDREEKEALEAEREANVYDDQQQNEEAKHDNNEEGEGEEGEEGEEGHEQHEEAAKPAAEEEVEDAAEEEEELDEEQQEARRLAQEEAEAKWREKMEERIWSLERRQAERNEEKARREMMQQGIDALIQLKNREIIRRKLAITQATRRGGKERERRGDWSRLVSIDMSGNIVGSEGAASLAGAIRHEIPMNEEELYAAKQAAGLLPTDENHHNVAGAEDEWEENVPDEVVNNNNNNNNKATKLVNKTRKVARSRYVWRQPNEENDEEHEETEEYEEDEEYEEEVEEEQEQNEDAEGHDHNETAEAENGNEQIDESARKTPAFKETKPGLQTIQSLALARCHIGFKGLQSLAKVIMNNCPSLTFLNLSNNPTCRKRIPDPIEVAARKAAVAHSEKTGEPLPEEFDEDKPVKTIIDKNWKSPGFVSLAEALRANTTLKHLDLSHNFINTPSLTALASEGFEKFPESSALTTLCLDGNPFGPSSGKDSDGGIALFSLFLALTHTSIKRLSLEGCGVGACVRGATNVFAGLSNLASQLEELRLSRNQLGAVQSFIESEHRCVLLPDVTEQLCLALTSNSDSAGTHLPLKVLALDDNLLDATSCSHLSNSLLKSCPNLISLSVSQNRNIGDEGVNLIIESLISPSPSESILLQQLNVNKCGIASSETFLSLFAKSSNLAWLDAGENNLNSAGLAEVMAAAKESPAGISNSLQFISLWNADALNADPSVLLNFVLSELQQGVEDEEVTNFPQLRQVDFGVRTPSGKAILVNNETNNNKQVGSKEEELSLIMAEIEFLLEIRRMKNAM